MICRKCGRKLKDPKRRELRIGRRCEKKEQEELEQEIQLSNQNDVFTIGKIDNRGGRQILLKTEEGKKAK